jgi:predicted O-methyltransferase YrrM
MLRSRGPLFFSRFVWARLSSYFGTWTYLRRLRPNGNLDDLISFVIERPAGEAQMVFAMQRSSEIRELLSVLERTPPQTVVEIGTASGGTLLLLTRVATPEALLVSIDLPGGRFGGGYSGWRRPLYKAFARAHQRIVLLRGDSHSETIAGRLAQLLGDRSIDFLLIDGDHRFEGVRADFLRFSRFVRPGGLIAFHDIVEDPDQDGMGVARFWETLRNALPSVEFIDDPHQAGYGIGLLTVPREPGVMETALQRL